MCMFCNTRLLLLTIILIIILIGIFLIIYFSLRKYTGNTAAIGWAIVGTLFILFLWWILGCSLRRRQETRQQIIYSY